MAEFCLRCLNKINGTHLRETDVIFSKNREFCEGCRQMKRVVAGFRKDSAVNNLLRRLFRL